MAARVAAQGESGGVELLLYGECFPMSAGTSGTPSAALQGGEELLRLYAESEANFASRLNGLFSALVIDRRRRRFLLFNDRYGIERIYVYEKEGTTYFASEAKALLRVLPELRAFDDEGVAQFLT